MRLISKLALTGAGLVALAGTAIAAEDAMKVMQVRLDDGTVVHIRYAGDRKPQVAVVPADKAARTPTAAQVDPVAARFAAMNAMFADMDRQMAAMQRQAAAMRAQAATASANGQPVTFVSTGAPAGVVSYSVVTTSNGKCSRTIETRYTAANQAPNVVEKTSGDCGAAAAPAPSAKPAPAPAKPAPAAAPRTVGRTDA